MNLKYILPLFMSFTLAYGQERDTPSLSPAQLEQHLIQAEKNFEIAEKMFDPYYTGPLLAPGVTIPDPGHVAIQPYLFYTDTYGVYDGEGHSHHIPHIHSTEGDFLLFAGLTKWMGLQVNLGYVHNSQSGHSGSNWKDPSITLLFPLLKEKPYRPGLLFGVRESFPAGKYQHLDPDKGGVDATGSGAYRTSFFFNIAKLVWSIPTHPMRFRLSTQYALPYHVKVHDFNAFGGGFNTNGTVRLPHSFSADFGYELSFTQKWAFALDVVYEYNSSVTFSGFSGLDRCCMCADVGGPFSERLSLAPAIEYSVHDSFGFIAGPWFSVWGKNSGNFISGVFSFYVSW